MLVMVVNRFQVNKINKTFFKICFIYLFLLFLLSIFYIQYYTFNENIKSIKYWYMYKIICVCCIELYN